MDRDPDAVLESLLNAIEEQCDIARRLRETPPATPSRIPRVCVYPEQFNTRIETALNLMRELIDGIDHGQFLTVDVLPAVLKFLDFEGFDLTYYPTGTNDFPF